MVGRWISINGRLCCCCSLTAQPRLQPPAPKTHAGSGSCLVPELSWTAIIGRFRCRFPSFVQRGLHLPRQSAPDQISIALERVKLSIVRSGVTRAGDIVWPSALKPPVARPFAGTKVVAIGKPFRPFHHRRFCLPAISTHLHCICTATELSLCSLCRAEALGASIAPGYHANLVHPPSNRRSFGPSFSP